MVYVKFKVHLTDGRTVELARSYKYGEKRPKCPYRWGKMSEGVESISTEFCTYKEKAKIYRRCDHAYYEPLIDRLEEPWIAS